MQREFSLLKRNKISTYFFGIYSIALAAYLVIKPDTSVIEYRYALIFLVGGTLMIIGQLRIKVIIEHDTISSVTLFRKKQIAFDKIEGIRINDKFIVLISNSPDRSDLYIHDYKQFKDSEQLIDFLKDKFENIDKLNFRKGTENQPYDTTYGFTPNERVINLAQLNKIASIINAIGLFFSFSIFIPLSIFKAIAIAMPLLCLLIVWATNNRIKLMSKFGPVAYPVIGTAFILPIFTVCFKSFMTMIFIVWIIYGFLL